MKTRDIREMIKSRYRQMTEEQTRDYHLTHDYYTGRALRTPYEIREVAINTAEEIAKKDHAYLTELLSPKVTLGNVFGDVLQGGPCRDEELNADDTDNTLKPSEDLFLRLSTWYARYQNEGVAALLEEETAKLTTANIQALQTAYPDAPVMVQNICIFAAFWLRSPRRYQSAQHHSMLEHVFGHYEAPVFLNQCWKESATPENTQWLLIYFAYTQGTSLKALAKQLEWKTDSPKLWHYLPQSRAALTPGEAVRYQEVMRLGGTEAFYAVLANDKAYQTDLLTTDHDNRRFWYSVVRWFVRHEGELVGTEINRVLTWARHQYTEFQRDRKVFTMNGRSLSKVIHAANAYHRAVLARKADIARRAEARRLAAIERERAQHQAQQERQRIQFQSVYDEENYVWDAHDWDKTYRTPEGTWEFRELTSSADLLTEAEHMRHCVYSYGYECSEGESAIVSLRLNGKRCVTLEVDPTTGDLLQKYGEDNREIDRAEWLIIKRWHAHVVKHKRHSRWP